MGIYFDEAKKIWKLDTKNTSYLIGLSPEGYVGHVYYGRRLHGMAGNYALRMTEPPFTPSVNKREKSAFLDFFPMEYATGGIGDYRESSLEVRNEQQQMGCEIFYDSCEIQKGKPALEGLPASFGSEEEVETLVLTCVDPVLNLQVELMYSAFYEEDVITRSVRILNKGSQKLRIEKAYSMNLDLDNQDFELLNLHGSWARERHIQRTPIPYGRVNMSSKKGESGHQEHPFLALVTPGTSQEQGEVYGVNFVYSGNFMAQAERSQFDQIRISMGILSEPFSWNLSQGESFQTPEVVLTYSNTGLGKMTRAYHDFYRRHMIRSKYVNQKRPILINNWEATYFNFDTSKLLEIAKEAKKRGIDLFVMDDGWFGKRSSDDSSLGDWKVNEEKLVGGLPYLVEQIRALGMEFGIWFEPEMISPDSDLYRAHPEWAIQIQGRTATESRAQYVLDLSRPEVVDYAYECVASILRSAPISYVKWDMNRQLSDLGSSYLGKDSQQELMHRYVLGVYQMQERLVTEFPDLLLENCSGGGARFDPGMLYYSPQIWCSDDTDAIERLRIQEGTSLVYPLSSMGSHVSVCPNHAVGRNTPFDTRGHVALAGTFGYELDVTALTEEEKEKIPQQVAMCRKFQPLIQQGDYYRLASWSQEHPYDCWAVTAKDKSEVLLTFVQVLGIPNVHSRRVRIPDLQPDAVYQLEGEERSYTGEELMYIGLQVDSMWGDYVSRIYHLIRS